MKGLLNIIPILGVFLYGGVVMAEDPVLSWIESCDIDRIEEYLQNHDVNSVYGGNETTLLVYSIVHGDQRTTARIIDLGADVNQMVDGISPLMYASGLDELKNVSHLVNSKADMEIQDTDGNTAIFYAAINGNLKIAQYLSKKGADLGHKNNLWNTAYDMAVINHKQEVAKFLRYHYEKNLPDLLDGPYISWRGKHTLKSFYMVHDSKSQKTHKSKIRLKPDSDPFLLKGFSGDSLEYLIHSQRDVPPDKIDGIKKIMVIGDIHGGFDSLAVFLMGNGVIDADFRWTWGDGYLVFVGDIFDRGEKVTESLWLIYQLESQAKESGGAAQMILGNHEIMVLTGNQNYVADKYLLMTSYLNIDYSLLFSKGTILGQWLRGKNTILKINDHIFVHAGLSPNILSSGLKIQEINNLVRGFLNHPDKEDHEGVIRNTVMGPGGPFWYRGYMEDNHAYKHLPETEFEKILTQFDGRDIFVGHTNVKQVTALYSNRVYALDVPFYKYGFPMAGLLLEGDVIYLLNSAGGKKQIR